MASRAAEPARMMAARSPPRFALMYRTAFAVTWAVSETVSSAAGACGAQGNLDPFAVQRELVRDLQDPIDLVERHVFWNRWLHHDAAHSSIPSGRVDNYGGIP